MHAKHLGTDKVHLGSVLFLLVHFVVVTGGGAEDSLSIVWGLIQKIYKDDHVPNRFGNLKMTMFTAGASPKLKGKAAEVKDLGPVLHEVWKAFYNPNLEVKVHRKIELVLRTGDLDAILEAHPGAYALPRDAAADLVSTAFVHLSLFAELRVWFADDYNHLFQLTQKGHYLMHCCLLSHALNPRRSWCYSGEDLMGKSRDLAASCSKGNSMWQVSNKMTGKYLGAMDLTLTDPDAWFWRRR
jgi:hypothetical protein